MAITAPIGLALLVMGFAFPGLARDEVRVFNLPAGAGPHDVAPAPDGRVWYTAQRQGALGILDPASGAVVQVPLGDGSAPHGVIAGPDGAAWITDGGLNAIVRYDPASGEVRRYPLPEDAGYANLNTAAFDGDGVLWFTGQSGFYGSLNPASGDMRVFEAPRGHGPYGITATPEGEVYYASLAGDHIAHIDRTTGEARIIEPPTEDQGARRVWSDSKGRIWVSEWNAGQLSVYDPKGELAGTNRITREYGGCVLQEHWVAAGPVAQEGSSFNTWSPAARRWHQTWVDDDGLLLQLEGGLADGKMVLEGETLDSSGAAVRNRITWEETAPGAVRQLWEVSPDRGGTWKVIFDGRYRRR